MGHDAFPTTASWTVPRGLSPVLVEAAGGGRDGASVRVLVSVTPGQAFNLVAGGGVASADDGTGTGQETSVALDGTPVLTAAGSAGSCTAADSGAGGASVVQAGVPLTHAGTSGSARCHAAGGASGDDADPSDSAASSPVPGAVVLYATP